MTYARKRECLSKYRHQFFLECFEQFCIRKSIPNRRCKMCSPLSGNLQT